MRTRSYSKYSAKKTQVDGILFDSKGESERYLFLKLMERAGEIQNLELQPSFDIVWNKVKVCKYKADFKYRLNGEDVIEDFKGVKTPVYNLKKKLMLATFGIKIKESNKKTIKHL